MQLLHAIHRNGLQASIDQRRPRSSFAKCISQLLADEQRTLLREHSTSMDVVWRFVAGLTKMQHIGWNAFEWVNVENGRKALQYHVDIGIAAGLPLYLSVCTRHKMCRVLRIFAVRIEWYLHIP